MLINNRRVAGQVIISIRIRNNSEKTVPALSGFSLNGGVCVFKNTPLVCNFSGGAG
jgi:hypothetical protein